MYERATRGGRMQFMRDVLFAAAWCPFDLHGGFTAADASAVLLDADGGPRLPEPTLHRAYSALAEKSSRPMLGKRNTPTAETSTDANTSELQSLIRTSYAVFCLKKKSQDST